MGKPRNAATTGGFDPHSGGRPSSHRQRFTLWRRGAGRLLPGGIRQRLFLLVVLVAAPILILEVWLYSQRHGARREQALQMEREVAEGVAMTFSAYLDGLHRQLDTLGQTILAFSPHTDEKAEYMLKAAVAEHPSVRTMNWVSPEGRILASNLAEGVGKDLSVRSYFQQIQAGLSWAVGDLTEEGAILDTPTVAMGAAVRDETGRLLGVVVASLEPTRLGELTFPHDRHSGGAYTIFDRQGHLVYRSPPVSVTWEDRVRWRQADPLLREALQGHAVQGLITSPLVGDRRLAARVPIPALGWVAGATRPVSIVVEPLRRALLEDVLFGLLVASAAFAMAALVARTIAEPIRRLQRDAGAMDIGAIEVPSDLQAPDEVHSLRRTVANMAAGLRDRADALQNAKDQLQEQTEELQVQAEELRQSEARHRRLIENLKGSHFVYVHNIDGVFRYVSESITDILGYTPQEFMTHYGTHLTAHPANQAARRHTDLSIQGIRQPPYEVNIRHKDGSTRWLEVQEVPVLDTRGQVTAIEGVAQDITERKRAEEALRESERWFRTLANATPQLVWTAEPDGRVDYYNERYREYSGIEPSADGDFRWAPVLHPADVMPTMEAWNHATRTGQTYQIEHRVRRADGSYHWHLSRGVPLRDANGRVVKWFGTATDIDDLKRAQEGLRKLTETLETRVSQRTAELEFRTRQLQRLTLELSQTEDRERRRLADILHDDLQQQLAAVKFHLGLLGNRVRADASLHRTAENLDRMLTNAIETSRSLSHELSPAMLYQADLSETLEWLAGQIRSKHGLDVRVHAANELNIESDAIKAFLYRTAQELLFNVVKHARVGKAVLRARRVGGYICLVVSDRGRGFDPQELKAASGFGLLSIRERVQLLGGRMRIRSARGEGSTFFIAVPDGQESSEKSPISDLGSQISELHPSHVPDPPSSVLRVLVADDHEIVRQGLAALLREQEDIQFVGEAANGREAVDLASRLRPDVVVMDVAMPLMNGDEATRQTKLHLPDTRVVALSMYAEEGMAERMRRAGAEAYILKTAPADELLAAIRGKKACA